MDDIQASLSSVVLSTIIQFRQCVYNVPAILFFEDLFIFMQEGYREKERRRELFFLFNHFPNSYNSRHWARLDQEPGTSFRSPM